ncbi:MAG: hypothetical protein HY903_17820 [Deltaproteobacteria bacterium]|nr:hypothetical protein [Deltaproteobacteria bacterium]
MAGKTMTVAEFSQRYPNGLDLSQDKLDALDTSTPAKEKLVDALLDLADGNKIDGNSPQIGALFSAVDMIADNHYDGKLLRTHKTTKSLLNVLDALRRDPPKSTITR